MAVLFKVWAEHAFADEGDRIGIIAASSLKEAVDKFIAYQKEDCDWGEYSLKGEPEARMGEAIAYVKYESQDPDGRRGTDSYVIVPQASDLLIFLAEDWRSVFPV